MTNACSETAFAGEPAVIVGTAGHVDHGKSSLVLALTGTDPDRLPQEKARGITVELGFAELALPGGRRVGLVDVPGHEHYVRAMVAGAAAVDVGLLVVAADDGAMPQTREHLAILGAMGARRLVVALAKRDLVDAEWAELAAADVEGLLEGTRFAGSPVMPCSARTGEGLPELLAELERAVEGFLAEGSAAAREALPARLSVDRAFNVVGVGAVVTGTLRAGTVAPGDVVEVLPSGASARVRSVQVHGRDVARARAGQRTALNLAGAALDQVPRGSTVCAPGSLRPCDRFDCRLSWRGREGSAAPLVSGGRVHVCAGTASVLGRVLLFDGAEGLAPGEEALAQIRLEEPLVLAAHDRFVVMSYSPISLAGSGEVLWTAPPRRSTPSDLERALLHAVEAGDERAAVLAAACRERTSADAAQLAASLDMPAERLAELLASLAAAGDLQVLGADGALAHYVSPAVLDELLAGASAALKGTARTGAADGSVGLPLAALRDLVCPRMDLGVFGSVVTLAEERGLVGRFGANVVAGEDVERVRREAEELVATVGTVLEARGLSTPAIAELAGELGMAEPVLRRGLNMLVDAGRAVAIDRTWVLSAAAVAGAKSTIAAAISAGGGSATAGELREALGVSRKYAMPLLEHLDKMGFTARADEAGARKLVRI